MEQDVDGAIVLSITYANDKGKLQTVKSTLTTKKQIEDLIQVVKEMQKFIKTEDERISLLETSTNLLEDLTEYLDTSLNWVHENLDNGGIFDYTLENKEGDYDTGFKRTITLLKGGVDTSNSDMIEITDMRLRSLTYIDDNGENAIYASIFPEALKDASITENDPVHNKIEYIVHDERGNEVERKVLDPDLIYNVSLNLDGYDEHINIYMNTKSDLNQRMLQVEELLTWEDLGTYERKHVYDVYDVCHVN